MDKEQIKGGKADNMSIEDIAKKYGVTTKAIEKEIEIGMDIESEHTPSKEKQKEIAKDHVVEDDKYYTDPETGLIAKEKEAEKRMKKVNEEVKRFMAIAGIKEGDKKFLMNESFSENDKRQPGSDKMSPENWKGMDFMPLGSEQENLGESKEDSGFTIIEIDQTDVEPGEDDEKLYKLK